MGIEKAVYALIIIIALLVLRVFMLGERLRELQASMRSMAEELEVVLKTLKSVEDYYSVQLKIKEHKKKARKRYIVFRVLHARGLSASAIEEELKNVLKKLYGEPFVREAMISLVYYDPVRGKGIVRTKHTCKDRVIAGMGFLRSVNGRKVMVIPIRTAGTIKKAREYI